jgi:tyrosyl-tRNA synthetase
MTINVYDMLKERDFIAQVTHEDEVREYLSKKGSTFYIGFDPTADSLHAGHLVQIMVMRHLQQAGLRPIALMGEGTGHIGDPSDRTDMRSIMSSDTIRHNADCFVEQMSRLLDFSEDGVILENNANWLLSLNYVDFIRDVGPHFTVNRMLAADCYRQRMDRGLSFLEFNYMVMQAYDFLVLFRKRGCRLQVGGDDQWSNIIAGAELIRRKEREAAWGLTFRLLTTSNGQKMGKTASGALWLDEKKCSVYDFYQYWRNVDDADVGTCMRMLTHLSLEEIRSYEQLKGADINVAKERLALEVTSLVHGRAKAEQAAEAARMAFSGSGNSAAIPICIVSEEDRGNTYMDVLTKHGLTSSKSDARRLIQQGGFYVEERQVQDLFETLSDDVFDKGELLIRLGKKRHIKLISKDSQVTTLD